MVRAIHHTNEFLLVGLHLKVIRPQHARFCLSSSYDSGSPIIIPGKNPNQDLLVAIVSGGEECAGTFILY
jgi:hypothetical protein